MIQREAFEVFGATQHGGVEVPVEAAQILVKAVDSISEPAVWRSGSERHSKRQADQGDTKC